MADRTVRVVLQAVVGDYRKQMQSAARDTDKLGQQTKKTTQQTHQSFATLGKGMVVGGGALLAGFGVAAHAAAGFEKEMSGVKAVSGATAGEMRKLSDAALKAGADTVFSASDAAKAEAELAKAGIAVKDILGGALTGALSLAAAGQLDLADAATVSAQAMNVFKLQGSDVGHIADVLAAAANKSAADVKDMGDGLRQSGLVAAQTGLSLEETAGALAAFADNALVGSDAGTSLKTMLQRLTPQSDEAAELMDKLGITAYDAAGNFVGLDKFAGILQRSLKGLTDEQRNSAMATIFGSDSVRAAAILYDQGARGIKDYVAAVDDQGAAARMAATQMDNLSGDVEALKGSLETAFIKGGSGATGGLRFLTQSATDAVNAFSALPTPVTQTVTVLAGVAGVIGVAGGAAMIGVGQLAKFKTSLETVGVSAERTTKLVGAAGLAMKGAAAVGAGLALAGVAEQINTMGAKETALPRITEGLVDLAQQGRLTGEALDTFGEDFEGLGKKIDVAGRGYWTSFTTGQKSIKNARTDLDDLDKALAGLLQQGRGDEAAAIFSKIEDAARRQGVSVDDLKKTFDDYGDAQASARTQTKLTTGATNSAADSAAAYADRLKKQKEASQQAAAAIREATDAMKAQFDPIFAVQDAMRQQTEAQKALNDARREHGVKSKEYAAADAEVLRTTVGVDAAVHQLQASLREGSTNLGEVNRKLDAFTRAGLISTDQAKRYKEQLAGTTQEAGALSTKLDGLSRKRPRPRLTVVGLSPAEQAANRLGRKLEALDGMTVSPRIHVIISQTGAISGVSNSRDEDFLPHRAQGGAVGPGDYIVGENGPERVRFTEYGRVSSNLESRQMTAAGALSSPASGGSTYNTYVTQLPGETLDRSVPRALREAAFLLSA